MKGTSNLFRYNGVDPFDDWATLNDGELRGYYPRNSLIHQITQANSKGLEITSNCCVISDPVKKIGRSCFRNNERFDRIVISKGVEVIDFYAFWGGKCKEIVIPKSVKSIKKNAFSIGVTLLVHQGSYAERYAIRNGFQYKRIEEI